MHSYLSALALGSVLVLLPLRVSADSETVEATSVEEQSNAPPNQANERKARTKMAFSVLGVIFGTLGVAVGGAFVGGPDCHSQGDVCTSMGDVEKKRKAGIALLVISPITLGTSIFGIVRSQRSLLKAQGKTKEPREPASWR